MTLKHMIRQSILAAASALTIGTTQAAPAALSNGILTARINDSGTFSEYYSDPLGSPAGTPGLSHAGIEYVNHGTPISWYWLETASGDVIASLGSNPLGATTGAFGSSVATTFAIGGLTFVQTAALATPNTLSVLVSITNNGTQLNGVRWGVGFDPDQGISLGGGYETDNTILGQGSAAAVRAAYGGHSVTLRNTTSASAFAVAAYIDPLNCCLEVMPATALAAAQTVGFSLYGDRSISLAYDLGTLLPGQTAAIGYEYVFAVPEPGNWALLAGGLLLLGITRRGLVRKS